MNARSGVRWSRLTAGVLLLTVVACGRTQPPAAALRIETVQLGEGQTLGAGRDADPATPGFQLDVEIRVTDTRGEDVPLASATLSWGVRGEGDFTEPVRGTLDASRARFPRLTLPASAIVLRLQVAERDGVRTRTLERNVTLSFDDTRPQVIGWSLPSDANGDGTLNVAELGGAAAVLQIETEGVGGGHVQVRERETQRELGAAEVADDGVSISLTGLEIAVERAVSFEIVLTNSLGNVSDTAQNPEAVGTFAIDGIAPTVTLLLPTKAILGMADDADPATAGFQLRARVRTTAEVGENSLFISLLDTAGAGLGKSLTPVGQEAQADFTVPPGSNQDYVVRSVAVDPAGNQSEPMLKPVTIDLVPPQITAIASPLAQTTYVSAQLPLDVTISGAEGRPVRVFRKVGAQSTQQGTLTVTGGRATGSLPFPNGTFEVTFEVADAAGNTATAAVGDVSVIHSGCAITIATPSSRPKQYLLVDDEDPGVVGLQTTLIGSSLECAGVQVSLTRNGGAVEATTQVEADGSFRFPVSLVDGESARLTVAVTNADQVVSSDAVDVTVDLTPATFDAVSPEEASLHFVAPTNVNLGAPGYLEDAVPGGDAQAQLSATVSGGVGGSVVARYLGEQVSSVHSITASPEAVTVPIVLPHGTSGELVLEMRDASGNVTRRAYAAVVDVRAPATPAVTASINDPRRATVAVSWTASGDDGSTGAVAGYDFRYSTDAVLLNGIQTEAEFFGSDGAEPTSKRVGSGLIAAGTLSQTLTLPPFAKYSFQVRAVDEVGNYSEFVAAPMVENEGSEIVLQNPGSGLRFGWKIAAADFDQDGVVDLAVANDADQSFTGAVYLYRGGPSLVGGEAWKKFTPPTAGAQYFGTSIAAGSVDGDANPDLIVGASTWQSSRGRVLLYFGQAGAGPDPAVAPVEFRGGHGVAGFFGSVVTVLPDLNGDGRSEIAVVASSDAGGRVYVYLGRTQAQWAALATEIEGDGVGFVSVHQADAVIQGPAPVAGQVALFGRDAGGTSVGDLNGDGVPEIAVAASRSSVGTVYIFSGAFIASRQGPTLDERAIVLDDAIQILSEPLTSTLNQGFGFEMRGSINLSGTESPDLLVSLSRKSQIFLYEAQSNGLFGPSTLLFEGPADRYFGNGLASGDVNGDGVPDLVVGENPPVGVTESEGWVMYHQGGGTEPFGRRIPNFTMSRLRSAHPSRGLDVEVVDLTGDGLPDVVTTEMLNPPGRVYVRH